MTKNFNELKATSERQTFNDGDPSQNYYSNLDCRWEIQGTDATKQVHVKIVNFDLESDGSQWCNDMITIEAGCGYRKEIR